MCCQTSFKKPSLKCEHLMSGRLRAAGVRQEGHNENTGKSVVSDFCYRKTLVVRCQFLYRRLLAPPSDSLEDLPYCLRNSMLCLMYPMLSDILFLIQFRR